jgi:hypothetical protein
MMVFIGSKPIGGPIVGWIGEQLGPRAEMGLGGGAALLAGIISLNAVFVVLEHETARDERHGERARPVGGRTTHAGASNLNS